jgi:membrane protein DedA with SNARE-associated domain/rhodanese-related sulfurtransferase
MTTFGTSHFFSHHGALIVFAAVFLEQLGLPLPAVPWLLAAGTLSAAGELNLSLAVAVTVFACLIPDTLWFYLGRYRGARLLGLLCRISLEPDSCVRRTQNIFTRYGLRGLLVAKFVPGMSTMAAPLAGMSGIRIGRFLLIDGLGSLLYCGSFVLLGCYFSRRLEQLGPTLSHIGGNALTVLVAITLLYIAYKFWQRQRLLRELRMARITADELHQKLVAGETPIIFDLRSLAELEQDPSIIRGASHLAVDDIEKRHHEFPHDRDTILYCSCPNEVTSARIALRLRRKGFTRIRPLLGGIDAWRKGNYPLEVWIATLATAMDVTPDAAHSKKKIATPSAQKIG